MCGYCIEGIALDFIRREKASEKLELENIWVPIYLQESNNISGIICELKKFDRFSASIDIAFFRTLELLIFQEHDWDCQSLINEFDMESKNAFLVKLKNSNDRKSWEWLADSRIYSDRSHWQQLINKKEQLIDDSKNALRDYYNFWILGNDKEKSDPEKRLEETGIMDPILDTTPNDWNRFYSEFPVVYFSFLILSMYNRDSALIRNIALENPHDTPNFDGYDLWLQRRAFAVCVRHFGVQFILDNYDDIRLELIYYSLLKESICIADLDVLKNHLLSHGHRGDVVDSDSVVELIDNLKSSGERGPEKEEFRGQFT